MSCSIWILSGSVEKLREQVRAAVEKEYPESEADIPVEQRSGTIPETLLEILEFSQKSMEEEVTVAGNVAPPLGNSSQTASATGQDLGTSSASGQVLRISSASGQISGEAASGQVSSASGHVRAPPRIEVGLHLKVCDENLNS